VSLECATRLAKLVVDHVLTAPCETAVLYPTTGGNIHAFTALTPCALLDVLAPPYSPATGRHCTYYHNIPRAVFSGAIFLACLSHFLMLNIVRETGMTSGIDSNGLG
jgi:hypothetical protein